MSLDVKSLNALKDVLITSPTNGQVLTYESSTGLWKNGAGGGGGGSGTVTSVSVVTANGFSGSVANATTIPAITLTYTGPSGSSTIVNDTSTNALMYPTWVTANTGNLPLKVSSTTFGWNPSVPVLKIGDTSTNSFGQIQLTETRNGNTNITIYNKSAGSDATSSIFLQNDVTKRLDFVLCSSTYSTTSNLIGANSRIIVAAGSGGGNFIFGTEVDAPLYFVTNGNNIANIRMSITSAGVVSIGSTSYPGTVGANEVIYATSSNALGSSSGFTFNGTTLTVNTTTARLNILTSNAANPAFFVFSTNSITGYIGLENSSGNGFTTTGGIANALTFNMSQAKPIVFATTDITRWQITAAGDINGIGSGKNIIGNSDSGAILTISSTSNATKGNIYFGSSTGLNYSEVNKTLGIGVAASATTPLSITNATARITMLSSTASNACFVSFNANSIPTYVGIENSTGNGFTTTGGIANALTFNMSGAKPIVFCTSDAARWQVTSGGDFLAITDNTNDIGASGATRPRTGYFGTSIVTPVGTFATSVTSAALTFSNTSINTTAGDSATINASAGRFRKDTSGSTFTLTNSFITSSNTVVLLTWVTAGLTGGTKTSVAAGSGSAVITFEDPTTGIAAAPSANADINFTVIN